MAMTAQQYLASLPPAEQQQVQASLATSGSTLDQWFQAAVDAGDPRAVKAAGGQAVEGGGDDVGVVAGQGAPSSEWLGKRKPTPSELIRYYGETGKSEDFKRYSARQVADWIDRKWDVANGYFTNDFGDIVEKPTESGQKSKAAGFATGEQDAGRAAGSGGGGKPVAPTPAAPTTFNDTLQSRLLEMFQGGEGSFAGPRAVGRDLEGGGVWWSPTDADTANVNPALAQATLTAFTPNAPSQRPDRQRGVLDSMVTNTPGAPAPVSSAATGEIRRTTPTTVPGQTPAIPQPAPGAGGTDILSAAVQRRFADPNRWWAGGSR